MSLDLPLDQLRLYIPLIQRFLLSSDKKSFINSFPQQGTEYTFLQLFIQKNNWQTFESLSNKLGLSLNDKRQLQKLQGFKVILDDSYPSQEKDRVIEMMIQQLNLNFDYPKPTHVAGDIEENGNGGAKLGSQLQPQDYSLQKYLKLNENLDSAFTYVTSLGLSKLDQDRILSLKEADFDAVIDIIDLASFGDKGLEILKKYDDVKRKQKKGFVLDDNFYKRLTAQQLQKLPNYINTVVNSKQYILQTYKKNIGYQIATEFIQKSNKFYTKHKLELKKELFAKAINWLKKFQLGSVQSFIDQLSFQILQINILIKKPDLEIFVERLKRPRNILSIFTDHYMNQLNAREQNYDYDPFWYSAHDIDFALWPNDSEMIEKYLSLYFEQRADEKDVGKQFQKYFKADFINKTLYKVRLAKGESLTDLHTVFSAGEETTLKNNKQLAISDQNQRKFKTNKPVSLKLQVKNIAEITAEIYEISTQKHYLSSTDQIDDSISLEFLEPLKKLTQPVLNDNPFKIVEVEFDLTEELGAKNSIFVINFQGDGLMSRAVIRRGSIVCITKPTLAGVELQFFQQDGKIIQELDLWIRGRKVHVTNTYTIPYGQTKETLNLIAVKDQYAELVQILVDQQSYNWKVSYTYHQENFLVGSKATVLLHATLNSNSGPVNTQALKDTNITVNIFNHLDIPSSLSFDAIKWDSKNQYQLEIPIQTYLKSLSITVNAKVDKYVGKPQQLSSSKTIKFRKQENNLQLAHFFLSSTTSGFLLNLLGKNGEPKSFVSVEIEVQSTLYFKQQKVTLVTDEKGQIKLGKLKDVKSITANSVATSDIVSVYGFWNFDSINYQVSYSEKITQREGEQINLPVYSGFRMQDSEVTLFKVDERDTSIIISDEAHKLFLNNYRLKADLPKGLYSLTFLALKKKILIEVKKFQQWGNSPQLINLETQTIYSIPSQSTNPISLPHDFEETDEGSHHRIRLKLDTNNIKQNLDKMRVHVLASSFTYRNNYSRSISDTINKQQKQTQLKLKDNISSYLNGKRLSDEHCYVLNREKEEKFIGNNLERPRVLLSRTFNRDTTVKKQELAMDSCLLGMDKSMARRRLPTSRHFTCSKDIDEEAEKRDAFQNQIPLFNNFLKNPSLIIPNLHGQVIEFDLPKHYQSFTVILASPSAAIQKQYFLQQTPIQTNNLISTGLKDSDPKQGYTTSRQFYKLHKGDTLTVNKSSQWTTVSASNLSVLSATNNDKLFDWALGWPSYTEEKKLQVYDQWMCHQLNTYVKYKDPEFFERVVKPFIVNKLEKGVVDYCLVGDKEALKYSNLAEYRKLNPFEKCLMIDYLKRNNNQQRAKYLAQALALEYKALKIPQSTFQDKFDVIMTSNQVQSQRQKLRKEYELREMITKEKLYCKMVEKPVESRGGMKKSIKRLSLEKKQKQTKQEKEIERDKDEGGASDDDSDDYQQQLEKRKKFKPGFQEVEKTKQYVETTYYEMKNPLESTKFISLSKFWVDLAQHFLNPNNNFLTESLIYLKTRHQLSLAAGFLPSPTTATYDIKPEGESIVIKAESSFLVFVKELKSVEFNSKYGILISQRINDPQAELEQEQDGTKIEKDIQEFVKNRPYNLQTAITNTSMSNMFLQILIDLPEGTLPLGSNQYTKVTSIFIKAYETKSYNQGFYFPEAGEFTVYPSNASKNKQVVSKANTLDQISVKEKRAERKLETLGDVLASGNKESILNFLRTKNIFDPSVFKPESILWLLRDKKMFKEVLKIFEERNFYSSQVQRFALYHKDKEVVKRILENNLKDTPFTQKVFEYHPLTSHRAHKFMKTGKSTILNQTFKQTYENFLLNSFTTNKTDNPLFLIVFTYYLILQDRIKEATEIYNKLSSFKNENNFPTLQYDYITCFLDIYTGYPNFATARNISSSYVDNNYPIETWRNLFKEINDLLNVHDTTLVDQDTTQQHQIKITPKGNKLSVYLPQRTAVEINFHSVNLELMFSNSPFDNINLFSTVKPFRTVTVTSEKGGEQFIEGPQGEFNNNNLYVQPLQLSSQQQTQTLPSFLWENDAIKVKVSEEEGVAVVFVDGKPQPGVYCKVYVDGNGETRFYKDGYTDIQGKFRYISELEGVDRFAILFVTEKGGVIKMANVPPKNGVLE